MSVIEYAYLTVMTGQYNKIIHAFLFSGSDIIIVKLTEAIPN